MSTLHQFIILPYASTTRGSIRYWLGDYMMKFGEDIVLADPLYNALVSMGLRSAEPECSVVMEADLKLPNYYNIAMPSRWLKVTYSELLNSGHFDHRGDHPGVACSREALEAIVSFPQPGMKFWGAQGAPKLDLYFQDLVFIDARNQMVRCETTTAAQRSKWIQALETEGSNILRLVNPA